MYFRRKQSQGRFYLQIVESHRTGDQVRQRVIATLGRLDELEASGQLDRLLRSGARFVRQAMVLDAARSGDAPAIAVRRIGRRHGRHRFCEVVQNVRKQPIVEMHANALAHVGRARAVQAERNSGFIEMGVEA